MLDSFSMIKGTCSLAFLAVLILVATVASAQSSTPWDGFYLGGNLGGMSSKVCGSSTLKGAAIDPTLNTTFTSCSGSGLAGGLQFGENFQINRLVLGIGADFLVSSSKDVNSNLQFTGQAPPPGTYLFSGKLSPNDFAILGARIGYGGNMIFPYLRAGGVVTSGSKSSTASYTPIGATGPVASFDGGKNFNSTGWAAGGGAEIGLNGAWSISAEYLHVSLGKGSSSATTCAGTATACAAFAGVTLDNTHNAFTANIVRIGINYWFNYWDKP
jgi:outer membrane immunogenic protein